MGPQNVKISTDMKTLILLVERLIGEIVYSTILRKLYKGVPVSFKDVIKEVSVISKESAELLIKLVKPLQGIGYRESSRTHLHYYRLEQGNFIFLISYEDFEELKLILRSLISELNRLVKVYPEAFEKLNLHIAIAADRDYRPAENIKEMFTSLGLTVTGKKPLKVKLIGKIELPIHVIEQGESEDITTGGIEDLLTRLIEVQRPELQELIKEIEKTYGSKLTGRQRFLIYLALLDNKPRIKSLYNTLREKILEQVDEAKIRQTLQNIITALEEALRH